MWSCICQRRLTSQLSWRMQGEGEGRERSKGLLDWLCRKVQSCIGILVHVS